ncbi:hypothetical protein [Thermoflexus sp.]|uniref:hypothetical protein n=1 Tax=Thermoflexus sp. TaxID=1969742 RepID=UPI001750E3F1|nr:hypothetical protein [Thermoflexus sp.]
MPGKHPWITGTIGAVVLGLAQIFAGASEGNPTPPLSPALPTSPSPQATYRVYLPLISRSVCEPIPGASYEVFPVISPVASNVADNPDYNLLLLGYQTVNEYKGLVDYVGGSDDRAPQFRFLFGDHRIPVFLNVYKNNGWDWENHQPLPPPPGWPPVSVAGLAVHPGEVLYVPDSGYDIGGGFDAHVLYADENQITLKYTAEDSTAQGYTVYITNICVEPSLLQLYRQWNAWGRSQLPALRGGQPFGRARGTQIDVGIRDNNVFMDPRSRKDWWQR